MNNKATTVCFSGHRVFQDPTADIEKKLDNRNLLRFLLISIQIVKHSASSRLIPNANCPYSRSPLVKLSTPIEKKLLRLLKMLCWLSNMPILP